MLHGHDWGYSSEVLKVWGEPQDGEVIAVNDDTHRLRSQILGRL